jgi:hypothetical protein
MPEASEPAAAPASKIWQYPQDQYAGLRSTQQPLPNIE